jgi:hypothetical protein
MTAPLSHRSEMQRTDAAYGLAAIDALNQNERYDRLIVITDEQAPRHCAGAEGQGLCDRRG